MAECFWGMISDGSVLLAVALIAHYVFLEPVWKKIQFYIDFVFLIALGLAEIWIGQDTCVILCMLCAGLNISLARDRNRIRGFFLLFPILGICVGLMGPILLIPEMFRNADGSNWNRMIDCILLIIILLLVWRIRKRSSQHEEERLYRQLQPWERRLLSLVGLLLLVYVSLLEGIASVEHLSGTMQVSIIVCSVIAMLLAVSVVVLVLQGNKKTYYENTAALNRSYLNAEVKHFEAYRKTQTETRRIRHDMKNHLQAMLYLAQEGRNEELRDYLQQLTDSVEQLNPEIRCGNTLADAICNEKNQIALQRGISFTVEGKMPETVGLEAVDICTIFANALDNALEALDNTSLTERWIKLNISMQGDLLFLRFANPVWQSGLELQGKKTTKQDQVNHGFGLLNIQLAAEKYNGTIRKQVSENGEKISVFTLEIMLFTTKKRPFTTE